MSLFPSADTLKKKKKKIMSISVSQFLFRG